MDIDTTIYYLSYRLEKYRYTGLGKSGKFFEFLPFLRKKPRKLRGLDPVIRAKNVDCPRKILPQCARYRYSHYLECS